jgi:hypothetical protein
MIVALKIVSCDILDLKESYQGTCFKHAFPKAYQYAMTCKKFINTWHMFLLRLHKEIYRNV